MIRQTKSRHRVRWLAPLTALLLVAAACGDDDDASSDVPSSAESSSDSSSGSSEETTPEATTADAATTVATDAGAPQQGGTITALMTTEVPGLDPVVGVGSAGGGPMQRMYAIFDALVYTESASGEVVMGTAQDMTTEDEGLTWTLALRPDITFSDGTSYDAEAVKFNWDRHAVPENGSAHLAIASSLTTEVVDPLTLTITLPSPNALFPAVVARALSYIGSPTAITELGADFNSNPVGAGPFVLDEWTRDSTMRLARNPDYWNAPRPYIDTLVFSVIPEDPQKLNAWQAGEGDMAIFADPSLLAGYEAAGAQLLATEQFGGIGIMMNLGIEKWQDPRVRRALALAIDRADFVNVVTSGSGEAPSTPFAESSPYYEPSITLPEHNLDEATALMNEYYADTGTDSFTFTYSVSNTTASIAGAELLQSMVGELPGVSMDLNPVTTQQLVSAAVSGDFDSSTFSYRGVGPEPEFNEMFFSAGSRNLMKYSNPTVDEAITTARTSTDEAVQKEAYDEATTQILEDQPFILLQRDATNWAYSDTVHDVELFEDGGLLADRVWIEP